MKRNFISFFKFSFIAFSMAGLVVMTGCGDDDEPEVDPLVGVYQLSEALLADDLTIIPTGAQEETTLPASYDMTEVITGILAAASPCENPANAAIELGDDGRFYYICNGEDVEQIDSGEWSSNEATKTITLTIQSETLGQTLNIIVTDYTITGNSFSGTIAGFPVPYDFNLPFGAPLPDGGVNFQLASIDATFTKIQ